MAEAETARSQGVAFQARDRFHIHVPQADLTVIASGDQSLVIVSDVHGGDAVRRRIRAPEGYRNDELVRGHQSAMRRTVRRERGRRARADWNVSKRSEAEND